MSTNITTATIHGKSEGRLPYDELGPMEFEKNKF
jgi:hypothetical protein